MTNPPSGREIARHLGVSPGRISQLRRDGLPTDSIEAAAAWYRANVDQVRSIGSRLSRGAPVPKWTNDRRAQHDVAALERAEALGKVAHLALEAGVFEAVATALRVALHEVPLDDRARLELPDDVWRALTAGVYSDIEAHAEPGDIIAAGAMPDDEREEMGAFWFAVAAGELGLAR